MVGFERADMAVRAPLRSRLDSVGFTRIRRYSGIGGTGVVRGVIWQDFLNGGGRQAAATAALAGATAPMA